MKPSAAHTGSKPEGRFSFSLYPADLRVLADVIAGLGRRAIKVDRTKVVRSLLHITPEVDLFAYAVGPSDLAASFGQLGNPKHPEVQQASTEAFSRLGRIGKPAGYFTANEAEGQLRIASGVDFVAIATDTSIITRGAKSLVERLSTNARTH